MMALRCVIDMTIRLCGRRIAKRRCHIGDDGGPLSGEAPGDGAAPRLPPIPRGHVIPAKAGTYPIRPDYGYEIPAFTGMTV